MHDLVKLVSTFVGPISLIMALVLMVSLARRADYKTHHTTLLMGAMFSAAVVYSMSDPIILETTGIFFDMRGLLVGTATALLGPAVGGMALATGLSYRWGLGGDGMVAGFASMLLAYSAGMLWRNFIVNREWVIWKKSIVLGVLISSQSLAIFLVPQPLWSNLFLELMPYIFATNIIGALLICYLIRGELSFLSAAETLKVEASTDHLTGLLNRRGLNLIYPNLNPPVSLKRGRALLYFDIDKFKSTNDEYGHAVGDEVLKGVVDRVAQNLRQNDLFVRLGGDEFAVVLPDIEVKEAEIIADRCRAIIADEGFKIDYRVLPVSISVGAVWSHRTPDIERLLHVADKALYQAKANGRNALVFLSGLQDETGLGKEALLEEAV